MRRNVHNLALAAFALLATLTVAAACDSPSSAVGPAAEEDPPPGEAPAEEPPPAPTPTVPAPPPSGGTGGLPFDLDSLPLCCEELQSQGRCFAPELIALAAPLLEAAGVDAATLEGLLGLLGECGDDGSVCVPESLLESSLSSGSGELALPLCADSQGVCLSRCIPLVDALPFPQVDCPADERCFPCFLLSLTGQDPGLCGDPDAVEEEAPTEESAE